MPAKHKTPKMRRDLKRLWNHFWWAVPAVLLLGAGLASWRILRPATPRPNDAKHVAAAACTGVNESSFKCWSDRLTALVKGDSTQAAFAEVKQAYQTNQMVQSQCHQLAHVIGRAAAERYGNVIDAYNQGDNFCWSGYYHGVMETVVQKIGYDDIDAKLGTICESARTQQPYSFYHYNCVHGLGHGLMAVKSNNLITSLKSCDGLRDSWEKESCYGGVFMENVMSSVNPDHHTDFIKADDPLYPCTAVDTQYKHQCYLMQTSHALDVVAGSFEKVFTLCSSIEAEYQNVCYQSLGRDASGRSISDVTRTRETCLLGPTQTAKENCFTGAVKDFISYFHSDTQGKELCDSIPDEYLKNSCNIQAVSYYKTF